MEKPTGQREELARLEGCLIWALGVPIVAIIVVGLLVVIWSWGTAGHAGNVAKSIASVIVIAGVAAALTKVIRTRR